MSLDKVVIVSAVRTPVGSFGGSLTGISAAELGELVVREAVKRANLENEDIDEVIVGQVGQVAEDGFIARHIALKADLPHSSTAYSVNRQCGSGLQAIANGVMAIQLGQADIIVAAGTENLSNLPYYIKDARWGAKMGHKVFEDGVIDILTWPMGPYHNGTTAEVVAEKYNVSREEQDEYACRSQSLAVKAIEEGRFKDEIVPVKKVDRKGNISYFDTDEGPRKGITIEKLSNLRPAFKKNGSVTAGNASTLNDGAAAVVLMKESEAIERGINDYIEIVDYRVVGHPDDEMGYAPRWSTQKLVEDLEIDIQSIDMIEINEAFASQVVAVARDLSIDMDKVNIYGGGISIGHPLGATGVVLATKVFYELLHSNKQDAIISMCIGGGQGISMYFRKVSN
ncbi:thiolase family protein [Enterococcus casseliflavus]|uniref:thiolase family protein n=1 Tax=Enterococcus casseliflavus TaxID=37734 RepID=UPI001AD790B0|nr:thiolase family protein [Enterococcus casseliflavus]MBO6359623.1 thiolase family protein [Enterococcus casseliflavus]MBO6377745.1 thiolase family protein [Enterococcus casseliflavus]